MSIRKADPLCNTEFEVTETYTTETPGASVEEPDRRIRFLKATSVTNCTVEGHDEITHLPSKGNNITWHVNAGLLEYHVKGVHTVLTAFRPSRSPTYKKGTGKLYIHMQPGVRTSTVHSYVPDFDERHEAKVGETTVGITIKSGRVWSCEGEDCEGCPECVDKGTLDQMRLAREDLGSDEMMGGVDDTVVLGEEVSKEGGSTAGRLAWLSDTSATTQAVARMY